MATMNEYIRAAAGKGRIPVGTKAATVNAWIRNLARGGGEGEADINATIRAAAGIVSPTAPAQSTKPGGVPAGNAGAGVADRTVLPGGQMDMNAAIRAARYGWRG